MAAVLIIWTLKGHMGPSGQDSFFLFEFKRRLSFMLYSVNLADEGQEKHNKRKW